MPSPPCASSSQVGAEAPSCSSAVGRPGKGPWRAGRSACGGPTDADGTTAPILALVGAEILSLMAFVGVCEVRAKDIALCESRWALALPAIALAG